MEITSIDEFEEKIENWDGKISVDTYNLEGQNSVLVLTLHGQDNIRGLTYRDDHKNVALVIHSLATKYNHKIIETQREDVKRLEKVTSHPVP